ncbi:unnamed protein product [Somion occarium]|uniref:DUF6699 domain-containing protein n=1 Tax=Somion occarium TaxID=3059160 RepID=A0ABP1CW32_9APHY
MVSTTRLRVLEEKGPLIAAYYGECYCPDNVVIYPQYVDPTKPWAPPELFTLDHAHNPENLWWVRDRVVPDMKPWQAHGFSPRKGTLTREQMLARKGSRLSPRYWMHKIRKLVIDKRAYKRVEKDWPGLHGTKRVPLPSDWLEYGYWARPAFKHNRPNREIDFVANSTPPSRIIELPKEDVEAMVVSLHEEDWTFNPLNWIPRIEHPMLPKRPDFWPTPHSSQSNLTCRLPSELILNPLLEHRKFGRPPILFDIRRELETILIHGHEGHGWNNTPLGENGCNSYQPATYPGVSTLTVNFLAEDTRLIFDWKFTVIPHHPSLPVMVIDVLNAIKENFDQCLSGDEVETIVGERRHQMWHAFERRCRFFRQPRIGGIKRMDYLGDQYYFRGLEPAPDNEGFVMFFGPP